MIEPTETSDNDPTLSSRIGGATLGAAMDLKDVVAASVVETTF
jgi:hypothetical protein